MIISIVQIIVNMKTSEKRSMSVPCETNGQSQITPEYVNVAPVLLSVLLRAKTSSRNSKKHPSMKLPLTLTQIGLVPVLI